MMRDRKTPPEATQDRSTLCAQGGAPAKPIDLAFVDQAVARVGRESRHTIPLLQALQEHYGYLPQTALERLCQRTSITPAQVAGVSTFYSQFRHRPVGEHLVRICHGTACHVKGSQLVHDALFRELGIPDGGDTSPDGRFTIEKVACLGCCTLAPVVQINHVTYGHLTTGAVRKMLDDFLEMEGSQASRPGLPAPSDGAVMGEVRVGLGSCCVAKGSADLHETFIRQVEELGLDVQIKRVGCVGMCHQTPMVEVVTDGLSHFYARVQPDDAQAILLRHFRPGSIGRRLATAIHRALEGLLTDQTPPPAEHIALDVRDRPVEEFLAFQTHVATEHCGRLDPLDLGEYRRLGGFECLQRALTEWTPEELVARVTASGLRGRGGAGFPTGEKWRLVRGAPGKDKAVICNGDEGDPGAFMDRMILESYPFRVVEGMIVAAWAVGATEGVFYIRAEYPLAVKRVREAIAQCEKAGILASQEHPQAGKNPLEGGTLHPLEGGTLHPLEGGTRVRLSVMEGAGAFVCGEETALLASIEGRRGMPRLRPPYPAQSGLWGRPTLVNNVETLATVPWILRNGAEALAALGTDTSKGTKVFALAGKVARGGLIEVPMGLTLRRVVERIGGGVLEGRKLKAVQVGGPSGGCIPERLCDLPIDYEKLTAAGAIMGSGGLVVLDDSDCMVDIARYFLEFTQDQSCGKCTFCRLGTRRMLDILERICQGEGHAADLEQLEQLALQVKAGSLCGLGKTAPNPVLTTLRYFRDEYEAHLAKRCPAGRCKALIRYEITDDCIGCTRCAQVCPAGAIEMRPYEKHEVDDAKCIRCDSCKGVCPVKAVRVI